MSPRVIPRILSRAARTTGSEVARFYKDPHYFGDIPDTNIFALMLAEVEKSSFKRIVALHAGITSFLHKLESVILGLIHSNRWDEILIDHLA